MKRGFLTASKASNGTQKRSSDGSNSNWAPESLLKPIPPASDHGTSATQPSPAAPEERYEIEVNDDQTVIHSDSPLILQSDYRFDSPYFGYFPPDASNGSHDMVYIDDKVDNIEKAMTWAVWRSSSKTFGDAEAQACFNIVEVHPKGLAMVASRDIKGGELIHSERPFYVTLQTKAIAPDQGANSGGGFHRSAASRLSYKSRKSLLSLSSCYDPKKVDEIPGKLATNYLPVDVTERPNDDESQEARKYCGAFETLSRANHSCGPNAK